MLFCEIQGVGGCEQIGGAKLSESLVLGIKPTLFLGTEFATVLLFSVLTHKQSTIGVSPQS
jgi:hypothetical protein